MERLAHGVFLLLLAGTVACNSNRSSSDKHVQRAAAQRVETRVGVTREQAEAFGEALCAAFYAGDLDQLAELIAYGEIFQSGLSNIEIPGPMRSKLVKDAVEEARAVGMLHDFATEAVAGGSIKVLRVHGSDRQRQVTVRVAGGRIPFEHYDFLLTADRRGRVFAKDFKTLSSGEWGSNVTARILVARLAAEGHSMGAEVPAADRLLAEHLDELALARRAVVAGRPNAALDMIEALPPALLKQRLVIAQRISIATAAGDAEGLQRAFRVAMDAYPNDAAMALVLYSHYERQKDHQQALQALDRLQSLTPPDPFLDTLRSAALAGVGRLREARQLIDQVVAIESDLQSTHLVRLEILLGQRDFAAAAEQIVQLESRFGLDVEDLLLADSAEYARFASSRHYRRMLARLEGASPTVN